MKDAGISILLITGLCSIIFSIPYNNVPMWLTGAGLLWLVYDILKDEENKNG
jgi:hypothetical protein